MTDAPRTSDDRQRDQDARLMSILRATLTDAERALHHDGIYTNPLAGLLDGLDRRAEERITVQLILRAAQRSLWQDRLDPLRAFSTDIQRLIIRSPEELL